MDNQQIITIVIFTITYIGIIFTRLPKINIDRPSAAFVGAVAMIVSGMISFEQAISYIDFDTITLLLGMMIIIAGLEYDGFFEIITNKTVKYASNNKGLLTALVFITGFGSAFLVNDAVVLIITPITILICREFKLNPIPYLIGVILACNAGSVMTMTGNPQNMLIGTASGMSYLKFFLHLLPVALLSMIISIIVVRIVFAKEFKNTVKLNLNIAKADKQTTNFKTSSLIFLIVILLFFLSKIINFSIPVIALIGASAIMIFGKAKPSQLIKKVDWVLLLFFAGLFIVVGAVEKAGLLENLKMLNLSEVDIKTNTFIHTSGLVISQIISNVPYAIAVIPIIKPIESDALWLILASSSTLAGNATIIGAVANLIVIETAEKFNVKISFITFFKAGIIATLLSFIVSILLIQLQIYLNLI